MTKTEFKEILDKYFEDVPENYNENTELTTKLKYGGHKIKVIDIYDGIKRPKIGDYVQYNVSYKDMYSNYEFTANNGWRILDLGTRNADGTYSDVKIISTGVPVKLHYSYLENIGNQNNAWWASDLQVENVYGKEYSTGSNNYPNRYMAVGLSENFESICFSKGNTTTPNQGIYTKVNSNETESIYGSIFKTEEASEVHALTLEELNKARGLNRDDNTTVTAKDASTGLFYLRDLANENSEYGYTESLTTACWIGTPYIIGNKTFPMYCNGSTGNIVSYNTDQPLGLRIVVSLNKKIK